MRPRFVKHDLNGKQRTQRLRVFLSGPYRLYSVRSERHADELRRRVSQARFHDAGDETPKAKMATWKSKLG